MSFLQLVESYVRYFYNIGGYVVPIYYILYIIHYIGTHYTSSWRIVLIWNMKKYTV